MRQFRKLGVRFYSGIERLKIGGFNEHESKEISEIIDLELEKFIQNLSTMDQFKSLQLNFDEKMASASSFVTSTSPFQMNFSSNFLSPQSSTGNICIPAPIDPLLLEKEIKTTGQQLNDEIKQLQADLILDTNLETKRREESDSKLEGKLSDASNYANERVQQLNEHLDKVSRQAVISIGGNPIFIFYIKLIYFIGFIGVLTAVFISYSLLSN